MAKLLSDGGAKVNVSIDGPKNYHDKFRGSDGDFSEGESRHRVDVKCRDSGFTCYYYLPG